MIETKEQKQVFGVEFDAEREELQIAANNNFYAGFRTMAVGKAMNLLFGNDTPANVFDWVIAEEALRALESNALIAGKTVLVVTFDVTLEQDTSNPLDTKIVHFELSDSKIEERED